MRVVNPADPVKVRTAALRMFSATYRGTRAETLFGIPIEFSRDIPRSPGAPIPSGPAGRSIEAVWSGDGAVCISHSRLWMRDAIVTHAGHDPKADLAAREKDFINRLIDPSGVGANPGEPHSPCTAADHGDFTSYVVHHID
jgi:hypothetical protein